MKHEQKSVRSLLLAGVLLMAVPMVAQQEVDPDHFESKPSAAQNQKPAPHHRRPANMQARQSKPAHNSQASKSNSEPQQVTAVVTAQADSNRP